MRYHGSVLVQFTDRCIVQAVHIYDDERHLAHLPADEAVLPMNTYIAVCWWQDKGHKVRRRHIENFGFFWEVQSRINSQWYSCGMELATSHLGTLPAPKRYIYTIDDLGL